MELGLINSAFAQAGKGTRFGLEQTKAIGFDTADVFADPLDLAARERRLDPARAGLGAGGRRLIPDTCAELRLPIRSIACVAVGLIDFNPSVQRFHVDRCKRYLDLCYEYRARNLLLVIGEYIWQQEVIPPAEQWRVGVENVKELGRYAANLGVEIVLELEPFKLSLVNRFDTRVPFIDDVGMPDVVRANCDISHLYLMGIKPAEVARLK